MGIYIFLLLSNIRLSSLYLYLAYSTGETHKCIKGMDVISVNSGPSLNGMMLMLDL